MYTTEALIEAAKAANQNFLEKAAANNIVLKNVRSETNETLLHFATRGCYENLIIWLLSQRLSLTVKNNAGATPLDYFPTTQRGNYLRQWFDIAIPGQELKHENELATGTEGKVYAGRWEKFDVKVAIKKFKFDGKQKINHEGYQRFQRETTLLANLCHPNIVMIYGICVNTPHFRLVMELLGDYNLEEFLFLQGRGLTDRMRNKIALDIACGLEYLHERGIIHRDMKSDNILFDEHKNAKIGDFGFAIFEKNAGNETLCTGTLAWMAPEVLVSKQYLLANDIYSFANVIWRIWSQESYPHKSATNHLTTLLFAKEKALRDLIVYGEPETFPNNTPAVVQELALFCWNKDPKKRPTAEVVREVFFQLARRNDFSQ